MKLTSVIVAALATVASAKPKFTNSNFDVVAGKSFELKWTDAKGPVTIELKTGTPPNGMKSFSVLATGVSGTSATVTIPKDVPSGQYAFTVADGPTADDTNWSAAFSLTGTGSSSSSSASAASTASSSSSSSGSATSSATSSSATTMATSTTSASAKSNSTTATTSSGSTSTKASPTAATTSAGTTGTIPNSNSSGNKVQSSLALVMLGAVAYAFLN